MRMSSKDSRAEWHTFRMLCMLWLFIFPLLAVLSWAGTRQDTEGNTISEDVVAPGGGKRVVDVDGNVTNATAGQAAGGLSQALSGSQNYHGVHRPILPAAVVDIITYANPASNWQKTAPADGTQLDYVGVPYYIATRSTSCSSIVIEDDGTAGRNLFGSWESPHSDIAYVANNVYRARFRIRTSQSDTSKVPKIRLFFGSVIYIAFGSQQINAGVNAPMTGAKDYWAYYYPPVVTGASDTGFKLAFDLVDFTDNQSGNLYLDEIQVQRFEAPAKGSGTSVIAFNASQLNSTWTYSAPGGAYGPITHGTSGTGLYLESSATVQGSGGIDYGMWTYAAGGSSDTWVANKLYRVTFTLQVPDAATQQTVAKLRLLFNNNAYDWIALNQFSNAGGAFYNHMPSASGTEYSIFCQTPDILYGDDNDKIGYTFDMADGSPTEEGRCYLTSVEVEYYDIP